MSRLITYQSGGFTNYGISYRKYSPEELEERKSMWVKGKPKKVEIIGLDITAMKEGMIIPHQVVGTGGIPLHRMIRNK